MRAVRSLLAALVLASCASSAVPNALLQEIQSRGASAVVDELWQNQERWDQAMAGIASGSAEWLDVAVALKPGTDAGATSELTVALFLALGPAPDRMLRLFYRSTERFSDERAGFFSPTIICSSDVYIDHEEAEAHRLIDARLAAVRAVTDPDLGPVRDACIQGLEEARALNIQ